VILQRYILRELIGSFLFAFCAILAVCLIGTMFQVVRAFPGLGLDLVAKAMPLTVGSLATWVILVGACTSSTLVYARLAAENEITAMRACGIHAWRIVAPAVLLGLLLVGAAYPLNEFVVPTARHKKRLSFREATLYALKYPPAGSQDFKVGLMRITYMDYLDGRMVGPTVSKYALARKSQEHKLVMECFAPSGSIVVQDNQLRIVMTRPYGREMNEKGQMEEFSAGNDVTIDIPPEEIDNLPRQLPDKPSQELWELYFKSIDQELRGQILLILHTRYSASLAPLLLVLVSMPIGILVQRGSRLAGLGAALPPLLLYFVLYFVFQGLGDKNRVSPLLAAYAPDLFLGALSSVLLWRIAQR
jgi:lipopolysaccharide export LptBFGC system permease protein LptF